MNIVAQLPRTFAVLLAVLMLGPIVPMSAATHTEEAVPDVPRLGHVRPGDECANLANIQPEVLAAVDAVRSGDLGYFALDNDVPSVCGPSGAPINEWVALIRQMDAILENYRNVSRELQRQADQRLEYTLPDGPCVGEDNLTRDPTLEDPENPGASRGERADDGLACGIVRPQFVVLDDRFDSHRLGGFGEWTIVTEAGEAAGWRLDAQQTFNGTEHRWRFGDEAGYPRGVHQWLISPELDLTPVRANASLVAELRNAYAQARGALRTACNADGNPPVARTVNQLICREGVSVVPNGDIIYHAYEAALDAYTKGLPLGQEAVTLEFTFRMNFNPGEDGVRPWVFIGDQPPTRLDLYGLNGTERRPVILRDEKGCPAPQVQPPPGGSGTQLPCQPFILSGSEILRNMTAGEASAFADPDRVAQSNENVAFTGDQPGLVTVRVPLSKYVGHRVWLMLEARTLPDQGRGSTFFDDRSRFPRAEDYGFEMAHIRVQADAYARNLRLKDVAQTYLPMPANNLWSDAPTTRTTLPPGNSPIVLRVHNAGTHTENATLSVVIQETVYAGTTRGGERRFWNTTLPMSVLGVIPGEVREIRIPWPSPVTEGYLYNVSASLSLGETRLPTVNQPARYADPNSTAIRSQNAAGTIPGAGSLTGFGLVRTYTDHRLTPVRATPGNGPALEVCKTVTSAGCEPLYAAEKGERRYVITAVRNDGSAIENAKAYLHLTQDGIDRSSAILDGDFRDVNDLRPGETRRLMWTIAPADPGIVEASVAFLLDDGTPVGDGVTRLIYVQRSTGLICFDDLGAKRACAPSFTATRPELIKDLDLTAVGIAPDGTLYAASNVTNLTGGLYAKPEGGEWALVANLSGEHLAALLGESSPGVGYGAIHDILVGPDGTVYLAGGNATLLARNDTVAMRRIDYEQAGASALAASVGRDIIIERNETAALAGTAYGGVSPYKFEWIVKSAPTGALVLIGEATSRFTNITVNQTGTYTIRLNVTDAEERVSGVDLRVTAVANEPPCREEPSFVASDEDVEPEPDAGLAADLLCIGAAGIATPLDTTQPTQLLGATRTLDFYVGVKKLEATAPVTYRVFWDSAQIGGDATWDSANGLQSNGWDDSTRPNTLHFTVSRADLRVPFDNGISHTLRVQTLVDGNEVDSIETTFTPPGTYDVPFGIADLEALSDPRSAGGVRLTWSDVHDGDQYVVRRQAVPDGPWATLGTVTTTFFEDDGLETGHGYNYTVQAFNAANGTFGARSAAQLGVPEVPRPSFAALAWWNGTLQVGGSGGAVFSLNQTSGRLERGELKTPTGDAYIGDIRALAVSHDDLYAAGEFGGIFVNAKKGWSQVKMPQPDKDVSSLAEHAGSLYAVGAANLVVRQDAARKFVNVTPPVCPVGSCNYSLALETRNGRLYLVDFEGRAASCLACKGADWETATIPLPTTQRGETTGVARARAGDSDDAATVLVGESGLVLDFVLGSIFGNSADWSTLPNLIPHDGGTLQPLLPASDQGWVRMKSNAGPLNATSEGWTKLRLRMHHYVAGTYMVPLRGTPMASVRLFYLPYPTAQSTIETQQSTTCMPQASPGTVSAEQVYQVCQNGAIMWDHDFREATPNDGWVEFVADIPLPKTIDGAPQPVFVDGLEFFSRAGFNWTIDDFVVEGYRSGKWSPVLYWYGPNNKNVTLPPDPPTIVKKPHAWQEATGTLKLMADSPWHVSTWLTGRPVWAFNDEVTPWESGGRRYIGGAQPHLANGWQSRLLTPIIDLSEAYDPVIEFNHLYAFRQLVIPSSSPGQAPTLTPVDGGWVEVQYLKRGTECGEKAPPSASCWSRFFKIFPRMLDVDGAVKVGYPLAEDMGLSFTTTHIAPTDTVEYGTGFGDAMRVPHAAHGEQTHPRGGTYWGRLAIPNERGVITDIRDTGKYQPAVFVLADQTQITDNGSRVDLAGRQIRVAFHAQTNPASVSSTLYTDSAKASFEGEGWYITDLKVKGARNLGIDLRASDLEPRVGYDVARVGLGPGTRIPVNVTVTNRGIFDAPGYTGQLEVRRITDLDEQRTERVALLPLSQQPLIEPGRSVNHTFFWNVPDVEAQMYTFAFTATPLGIDVDEDPTDNVATFGSFGNPAHARTTREFHVEFLVTPENATTDIPRYVPIFINNTGNVPLGDFTVTREITALKGILTSVIETKTWTTHRPVAFGSRVGLQTVSDDVDPATDYFWKAPERSSYLFQVAASAPIVGFDTADRRIAAFATYLFDDVDAGPRGEATTGDWAFGDAWSPQVPGFRSDSSYAFGQPQIQRYPDDVDSSAVTPTIDLSSARSARFGLYTRWSFLDPYDAGVVEASADGGTTWQRLTPRPYLDDEGKLRPGYSPTPVAAASPLHLTGDPRVPTYAFTGDSSLLPGNSEGWVYREFDLTQFANVTEDNVPYELFDASALSRYSGKGAKDTLQSVAHPSAGPNVYFDSTWHVGAIDEYRYWEVQNLTEASVRPPTADGDLWWSGSVALADDGRGIRNNQFLRIPYTAAFYSVLRDADSRIVLDAESDPIILTEDGKPVHQYDATGKLMRVPGDGPTGGNPIVAEDNGVPRVPKLSVDPDEHIVVDWWEWAERYGEGVDARRAGSAPLIEEHALEVYTYSAISPPAHTLRFNVSEPALLEKRGKWFHLSSDITAWSPAKPGQTFSPTEMLFAYAPVKKPWVQTDESNSGGVFWPNRYWPNFQDDRGFAVDGFTVRSFKVDNGQEVGHRLLMDETVAWQVARFEECGPGGASTDYTSDGPGLPCWSTSPGSQTRNGQPFSYYPRHGRSIVHADRLLIPANEPDADLVAPLASSVATGGSDTTLVDTTVSFEDSGVQPGDRLVVTSGAAAGRISIITKVGSDELEFAPDAFGPTFGENARPIASGQAYRIEQGEGHVGEGWGVARELPAMDSSWQVTPVRDAGNHSARAPLPTGDIPRAWYTGGTCRALPMPFPPGGPGSPGEGSTRSVLLGTSFQDNGVKPGDVLYVMGVGDTTVVREVYDDKMVVDPLSFMPTPATRFQVIGLDRDCMRPGEESRLVTPSLDLSRIAGDEAKLAFWHRYAFTMDRPRSTPEDPLASGGVVEVQVYDSQTRTWGKWQQIYARPDARTGTDKLLAFGSRDQAVDGERLGVRGGYSAYTVNGSRDSTGTIFRNDAPFEPNKVRRTDGRTVDVQYLYAGNSSKITGDLYDGWVPAHFDLTDFIGKKVRVGFHVAYSGAQRDQQNISTANAGQNQYTILAPHDVSVEGNVSVFGNGWWLTNISIVGKVLNGAPIQLRLRTATDANVHEGRWQFDDAGLFGARYGRNVGIFVDATKPLGALEGSTVTVPVTLRNLGDSVRRGLAVEIRQLDTNFKASFAAGPGVSGEPDGSVFRLTGFNLAPGQSASVPIVVRIPTGLGFARDNGTFFIEVKEYSPADDAYVDVSDNEVQGFLARTVKIVAEKLPDVALDIPTTTPAVPAVNAPLQVRVAVKDRGFADVTVDLTCTARMLTSHPLLDHRDVLTDRVDGTPMPCSVVSGAPLVPAQGASTWTFNATPPTAGIAAFTIAGSYRVGASTVPLVPATITAVVGRTPVLFSQAVDPDPLPPGVSSDTPREFRNAAQNWTPTGGATFAWPVGHDQAGALLFGLTDEAYRSGAVNQDYSMSCVAPCAMTSVPIDLHNYTKERLALSFWHMDRFAGGDGARVYAQVLLDEARPLVSGAWSRACLLTPRGGYEGDIWQYFQAPPPDARPTSSNGFPNRVGTGYQPDEGFFTNPMGRPEFSWSRADVDLSSHECDIDANPVSVNNMTLVGHTVRFIFQAYLGPPGSCTGATAVNCRGRGQGWFVDDVVVTPMSLTVAPPLQRQVLLDNTTKLFNVLVKNVGSYPDVVAMRLDAGNSSIPQGAVSMPAPVTLAPGESKAIQVKVTLPRDPSLLATLFRARVVVGSLLDPSVSFPTDLELSFAPRQWAELAVHVDAPRQVVQEGTETFIPVTIENTGLVESPTTTLRIIDRWATGEQTYELDLPAMPSYFQKAEEATRIIEFRWRPPTGSVGPHTLIFEADPLVLGEEYTRTNNVVTLVVPVSDLLIPDLDVSNASALRLRNAAGAILTPQKDADLSRYEVTAGDIATVEVTLRNTGKAGATSVNVSAFIGTLSLPPKTIPYIPPGGEVTLSFNWLAQKGEYPIEIVARSEQLEASNANNRNPVRGVTLLIVKGYEVQTRLAEVTGDIVAPKDLRIPFNITNSGNAGEELALVAKAPDGWTLTLPRDGLYLRAGETYSATATLRVPEDAVAGEQLISILAVARENSMKVAAASTLVNVRAFYGGSVVTTSVVSAPPELEIPIDLSNEGNSLEPWTVLVKLPPGWTTREAQPLRVSVPAHGKTTLLLHAVAPETTPPGQRTIIVNATMPNGEKREGTIIVDVQQLRTALVKIADDRPRETQGALAYAVTVENAGNVAEPFKMVLIGAPPGIEAKVEPAAFALAPGAKQLATLIVTPGAGVEAGAYAFTGYTLFEGVSPDSAEGRTNVQHLQLTLVRPDLRVSPLEYAPRTDLRAGDHVVARVSVANRGQGTVHDIPVHLFADDLFVGETRIKQLAPNEKRDVLLNWTALPGDHTLTAVVDPYRDSVDVAREDNAVSSLVTVKAAAIGGLTGGAKVPAPDLGTMLVALAGAVFIALQQRRRPPR